MACEPLKIEAFSEGMDWGCQGNYNSKIVTNTFCIGFFYLPPTRFKKALIVSEKLISSNINFRGNAPDLAKKCSNLVHFHEN